MKIIITFNPEKDEWNQYMEQIFEKVPPRYRSKLIRAVFMEYFNFEVPSAAKLGMMTQGKPFNAPDISVQSVEKTERAQIKVPKKTPPKKIREKEPVAQESQKPAVDEKVQIEKVEQPVEQPKEEEYPDAVIEDEPQVESNEMTKEEFTAWNSFMSGLIAKQTGKEDER